MKKKVKKRKVVRRRHKRKNHLDAFFLLNWKKTIAIIALWILSVVAHNAIFRLYMIEEPFFFILAILVIPAYLIAAIIYTLDFHRRRR